MVGVRNCALVVLVACLPIGPLAPPAAAAPLLSHPQDDWAGAQIAKYEGVSTQDAPLPIDLTGSGDAAPPAGLDVSSYQGSVNWPATAGGGAAFAYVKATESTNYVNPSFGQQYRGAAQAGLVRGAYHFATPNTSDGPSQANWFADHGGGWSPDGRTLPPAIDLEYNPYGPQCYGMTPAALVAWVHAFADTLRARTHRFPVIYTSARWWGMCMGGDASFTSDPLWIARYASSVGPLPPGWTTWAMWQFADSGRYPGDQDTYDGSMAQLRALAGG